MIPRQIKKHFLVFTLAFLVILIAVFNYKPGTWLSGWDNLHPEFNFSLNVKRSIFAAWQEYQGLGLLGGMGHASDLLRQIFLWIATLIFPVSFIRYFYHFLMLLLGPLGVYFLLKKIILKRYEKNPKEAASLIGAVFYLFNLATLQTFYVPFEPFSTHFAFLPWLFFANLNYLNNDGKKRLLFLLFINLLAIPQGYVGTCFLVYIISLSLVFLFYFLQKKQVVKKILIVYLIAFCVNAFWLLPNLYFVATNIKITASTKTNQMATENSFLKNKKYGDLSSTAILRGFWFDNVEMNEVGVSDYQMGTWVSHLKNLLILSIGYFIFLLCLVGIFVTFKKKIGGALIFLPLFLFALTLLSNSTPFFSFLANLLYKIPLFYQIFRFPFTKFAILVAFCLSIFYSIAYFSLSSLRRKKSFAIAVFLIFLFLPIIFLYPMFLGKLFYSKNRSKIPLEYFQIFNFFKNQKKNERIANFPQYTFWGWTLYRWNYSGSGFVWYGIEQPILDRAFDVWSDENENYYWEINYALYSQNLELFEKVLEKYQITWLLIDENVINPPSSKALYFNELKEMIGESKKIFKAQEFGKIKVYQVQLETPVKDFVFLAENLPEVEPKYNWNNYDQAYSEAGNYISIPTTHNSQFTTQLYFPFRSLFTGRSQEDLEFKVEERGDYFVFRKRLPDSLQGYQLVTPENKNEELIWVNPDDLSQIRYLTPEVHYDGKNVEVIIPKAGGYFSAEIEPTTELLLQAPENCNQFSQGEVKNEIIDEDGKKFLRLMAIDAKNCSPSFSFPHLSHKIGYLIKVESRNQKGKSLLFWLENFNIQKPDIETYLPKFEKVSYFIQPPMEEDGLGYALHFDNTSIGRDESINDLGKITLNPIPFKFLTSLKFVSPKLVDIKNEPTFITPTKVFHPNPSFYRVELNEPANKNSQILVLSQSFNKGWQAFQVQSPKFKVQRIKNHLLVNNWANGWLIDQSTINNQQSTILLIFLPQLLEYFGFLLLLIPFALLAIF